MAVEGEGEEEEEEEAMVVVVAAARASLRPTPHSERRVGVRARRWCWSVGTA